LPPSADESAREHAVHFIAAADDIVASIQKLFEGVEMPRSDFSVGSLWT
jgi:hypothetical protein